MAAEITYQVHYSENGEIWEIEYENYTSQIDVQDAVNCNLDNGINVRVWLIEDARFITDITDEFVDDEDETVPTDREEHSLSASQLGVGRYAS